MIEDYLSILSHIFVSRGYEVVISEKLDEHAINIIIDGFTDEACNIEIAAFRHRHPDAKLFFVLTEFIESWLFVRSYNWFSGSLLDAAVIAAMNVFFRLRRQDFLPPNFRDWLVGGIYSPVLLFDYLVNIIINVLIKRQTPLFYWSRPRRFSYWMKRYLGLEKIMGVADGVVLSHCKISRGLKKLAPQTPVIGTLCPEIDIEEIKKTLFSKKELFIEVTGTITPYRLACMEKINTDIGALCLKGHFQLCRSVPLSSQGKEDVLRGAYSLHPPQTDKWKYSSPTRIFRALQHDNNMPVLTKIYNQHPIEDICLVSEGTGTLIQMHQYYHDHDKLFADLAPRMKKYADLSRKTNNAIVKKMIARVPESEAHADLHDSV